MIYRNVSIAFLVISLACAAYFKFPLVLDASVVTFLVMSVVFAIRFRTRTPAP